MRVEADQRTSECVAPTQIDEVEVETDIAPTQQQQQQLAEPLFQAIIDRSFGKTGLTVLCLRFLFDSCVSFMFLLHVFVP